MRLLLSICCLLLINGAFAQRPPGQARPDRIRPGGGRGGVVRGMVTDTAGKVLREATVSLLTGPDSSYVTFTITDGDGQFQFRNVATGSYRILVTYVGYRNGSVRFTVMPSTPAFDLGTLKLIPQATTLNEVTVVQERPPIAVKQDTIEYNAGSFKTRPNAQVEDLLKKLPGVEVSRDGTIKAQGQQVNRVLVDGKPFFGDDPKMATRNLPADIIDKVQLYDQQSEQAQFSGIDDGNREKTINLTTKRDKRKGYFGRNAAGAGTNGRYQAQLNVNHFNNRNAGPGRQISLIGQGNNINQQGFTMGEGIGVSGAGFGGQGGGRGGGGGSMVGGGGPGSSNGSFSSMPSNITESLAGGINYRDAWGKRLEVATSYFLNRTRVTTERTSRRENILPNQRFISDNTSFSRNQNLNHRFNLRLEAKLDSFTTLRFMPSLSWQQTDLSNLSTQFTRNLTAQPLNQNETRYNSDGSGLNGFSNLLLMRKFRREGRTVSINLNTVLNGQEILGYNRATNTFFQPQTGVPRPNRLDQQNDQQTNVWTNNLTLSYTEPLSLSKRVEFRYAYSTNQNVSERLTSDFNDSTGRYDLFNPLLSNQFSNVFATHRGGVTFQNRRLKYAYNLGADIQQALLNADNQSIDTAFNRRFMNLLPTAMFSYNWSRNRTLRLNYRTRINAPSVSQLQPVPDNRDPLNIRLGNPALKPEFYNTISLTFNNFSSAGNKSLFAILNLNQASNRIVNASSFSETGVQTTRPVNADGFYSINGFVSVGRQLKPLKINVNWTTNAGYNRGVGFVNGQENFSGNWTIGQGLGLNSNFTGKIEFGLTGNLTYQTARYSLQSSQNTEFFTKTLDLDVFYELPFRFNLTSDLLLMSNTGRSAGFNQRFALWNLALSRQFFKNRQGELRLQVFDLLNQNRSITRNVTETYLEDVQSRVLNRYFMLSFVYNLRKFGR